MKYLKYSLVILLLAVVCDFALASAAGYFDSPMMWVTLHLDQNKHEWSQYVSKTKNNRMSYKNISTITIMTNPCPNCKITTAVHKVGGNGAYSTIETVTDETKYFSDVVGFVNDYQLELWRSDFTLLKTIHNGIWYIS